MAAWLGVLDKGQQCWGEDHPEVLPPFRAIHGFQVHHQHLILCFLPQHVGDYVTFAVRTPEASEGSNREVSCTTVVSQGAMALCPETARDLRLEPSMALTACL